MKVEELRVENYVDYADEICTVKGFNNITNTSVIEGKFQYYYDVQFTDLSPIPLTEELLLKCGFEAESKYCDLKLNGINISSSSLICKTLERRCFYLNLGENNENLNISIDYLHQLQNLYFALTNEELKIEL